MDDTNFLLNMLPDTINSMDFAGFALNLIGAGLTSFFLGLFYTRYGTSLSNRAKMAQSFSALSMTTMLIISIIKSNLALSLGLVGALSIVRFRAAIKEPEELIFLFLNVAIGIGFGAGQGLVTVFAVPLICLTMYFYSRQRRGSDSEETKSLFLTVKVKDESKDLPSIMSVIDKYCQTADLSRFNRRNGNTEVSFVVTFKDLSLLDACQKSLVENGNESVSIIENTSIFQ